MNKNDWTDKLREQLTDYQEPVSHDLWADIEQSLTKKTSTHIVYLRRFSIAATLAALLVGGTYVYLNPLEQDATFVSLKKHPVQIPAMKFQKNPQAAKVLASMIELSFQDESRKKGKDEKDKVKNLPWLLFLKFLVLQ